MGMTAECVNVENYNAGYGGCATYSPGMDNYDWCSFDVDFNGIVAEDACSECGKCVSISCQDMPNFTLGTAVGYTFECDWFAMYEEDYSVCELFGDWQDSNGYTAKEACCACA